MHSFNAVMECSLTKDPYGPRETWCRLCLSVSGFA
jgi:hypothetical protein